MTKSSETRDRASRVAWAGILACAVVAWLVSATISGLATFNNQLPIGTAGLLACLIIPVVLRWRRKRWVAAFFWAAVAGLALDFVFLMILFSFASYY